jgi:hypothetical protein
MMFGSPPPAGCVFLQEKKGYPPPALAPPMRKSAMASLTFRYKQEIDPDATPQFGLVAEDVAEVNPDLVTRDNNGEIYSVRYEAVNAMLLNEFLKEHKAFLKEHRKVEKLEVALLAVNQRLAEQSSQIQKVSAQLELRKPSPQTVLNNQ